LGINVARFVEEHNIEASSVYVVMRTGREACCRATNGIVMTLVTLDEWAILSGTFWRGRVGLKLIGIPTFGSLVFNANGTSDRHVFTGGLWTTVAAKFPIGGKSVLPGIANVRRRASIIRGFTRPKRKCDLA
jgi:hypothetical protein